MTKKAAHMTGTFGFLTIIERRPPTGKKEEAFWLCRCACDRVVARAGSSLRSGKSTSCGCTYQRNAVDGPWNDKTIATLRELWDAGVSTAEIGRRLHVSKNAIVGKAGRLSLVPRPSPIMRGGQPRPVVVRAPRVTLPAFVDTPEMAVRPVFVAPPPPPPVAIPRFSREACCFPVGDARAKTLRFCGDVAVFGRPYCPHHCGVAYVKRREVAA